MSLMICQLMISPPLERANQWKFRISGTSFLFENLFGRVPIRYFRASRLLVRRNSAHREIFFLAEGRFRLLGHSY